MARYPRRTPGTDTYAASRALFDALITRVGEPQMAERPEHAVEEFIAGAGRDVLKQMLQDHLDARAAAEPRLSEVAGADQVVRRRAEPGHTRLLATTLGPVEVTRIAYRAPAVSNLHPADARLVLPEGRYSFPLRKAVVHESVTGALREAREGLARMTGTRVGTQQLMQITVDAAHDVRDFYRQHPVPAPAARGDEPGPRDLLVLSIDATGINMIDSGLREAAPARSCGPQPPSAQLACRERAGRTRMAVVTACYDAAPAVRGPADILPTGAGERSSRRPGPKAVNRELDASVVDSTVPMLTGCSTAPSNATRSTSAAGSCWSTATTTRSTASTPRPTPTVSRSTSSSILFMSFNIYGMPRRTCTPPSPAAPPSSPTPPATSWNTTRPGSSST